MGGAFVLTLLLIPFVASNNIEVTLELVKLFSKNLRTARWQELREFADSTKSTTKDEINAETSADRAVQQCERAFRDVQLFCSHEPITLNIALTQQRDGDGVTYPKFTTSAIHSFNASKRFLNACLNHLTASIDSLKSVKESVQRKTVGKEMEVTVYSNGTIKFYHDGPYQQSKLENVREFLVKNLRNVDDANVHYFNYGTKTSNARPTEEIQKISNKLTSAHTVVNGVVQLIDVKLSNMNVSQTSPPVNDNDKTFAFYDECKLLSTLTL